MLNKKKIISAFLACTIACSAVYSGAASLVPTAFAAETVGTPMSSVPTGRYEHSVSVTLTTATAGADIYYTLDGTLPDETSLKFTGTPIAVTETTNVSVIALKSGVWSKPATYGYIIKTAEQPLLKFVAMSDVHLSPGFDDESVAQIKARYASNFDVISSIFSKPDAIVIAGDLINDNFDGKGPDHAFVSEVFQEQMTRKNWSDMPVQIAIGNHDASATYVKNGYPAGWFTDQANGYYEKTIGGYSFFFLNGNSYKNDTTQRNWLKGRLAAITGNPANRNKPIFITLHHPITGTVMDGMQADNANLYTDLQDYPQVMVLSGHSHLNINDDRAIYQKDFTEVNVGSMSYVENEWGYSAAGKDGLSDDAFGHKRINQSQFIEVYQDRIEIERVAYNGDPNYLLVGGVWQEINKDGRAAFNSAGALAGKKWVVRLNGNTNEEIKSNFTYTPSNRNKTAPQFPANHEMKVVKGADNVPVLSFRQAKDDQSMHHYEVKLYDQRTAKVAKSYNVLSDFYYSPIPNRMNIPMVGLDPATNYILTLQAVDAYGNKSAAWQTTYRTEGTKPELTPIEPATMWNQLVSDMKFDGNLNEDASGTTGLAAQTGAVTFVEGKSGQAVHIAAGNGNYVDLGDRSDLKFGSGDFTVSFWHMGNLAGDQTVLSNKNWNSGGNVGWYIGPASAGNMSLNMATGSNRVDYSASNVGIDWHHFTISVNRTNNTASTYVDGVMKATKDITALRSASLDTTYHVILGADGNIGNGGATVVLDDLKVWKRALSATEAKALSDSYHTEDPTEGVYNFAQLTAKIQESDQFTAYLKGTIGLSVPEELKHELTGKLAAAKVLTADSAEETIDQAFMDLNWALQNAQNNLMYIFIPKKDFSIESYSTIDLDNSYASNILDGEEGTIWHSRWESPAAPFPHWVIMDMEDTYKLSGIQRKSRTDSGKMEFPKTFEVYASNHLEDLKDSAYLSNPANKVIGTFGKTWTGSVYKDFVSFDKTVEGRYVKFVVTGTYNADTSKTYTSMSEIDFTGKKVSTSDATLTDLKINGASLSDFAPDKLSYAWSVPNEITVATVTYTAADPTASVVVTGGQNLNIGANTVAVKVTALDGTASDYTIVVTRQAGTQTGLPIATMTGLSSILTGQSFSMKYGLSNVLSRVDGAIFAQDLTFQFNPNLLEFVSATSLKDDLEVYVKKGSAGKVRVLLASLGAENSVTSDGELLELHWKAKEISKATSASVTLSQVQLGHASGESTSLDAVTNNVQINVLDNDSDPDPAPNGTPSTSPNQDITQTSSINGVQLINSSPDIVKNENGQTTSRWIVDAVTIQKAINALSSSGDKNEIQLEVKGTTDAVQVQLPAEVVKYTQSKVPNAVISVKFGNVTYDLPIKTIDVQGLANALGTDVKNVKIIVTIEKLSGTVASQLDAKIQQSGFKSLAQAVDFTVTAEGNGKSITVNDFGKTYVNRTLALTKVIDAANVTAIMYNPTTGEMDFVPAIFTTSGGNMQATIKRLGNSIYTVVESSKSFDDMNGHWAKADIELLASKLVIKGMTETNFVPESQVTRAEFTALLVRGLGLTEAKPGKFTDVKESDWYSGAVGAAAKAGLVEGFEDGTFSPNANITREQMAVMITRAMALGGTSAEANTKVLQAFEDEKSINGWAKDAVARAMNAGIMNGMTNSSFMPGDKATRAQASVIMKRLLQFEKFMN